MRRLKAGNGIRRLYLILIVLTLSSLLAGCSSSNEALVVYSGRTQSLVQPLLLQFAKDTGIDIRVKYLSSSAVAALLLEEGENTEADVVYLQDAGALGALSKAGMLEKLPDDLLNLVDSRMRSPTGEWIGTSGRARVIVYNTKAINPETDLPDSIMDFTDPAWKGRIGWAPPNASFQAFVTAMRFMLGDEAARQWLTGIMANDVTSFPNNVAIVDAVGKGELDVGFVNHYYLYQFLAEQGEGFGARNHYIGHGDIGALINVAGAGIVKNTNRQKEAERFVEYLLDTYAQTYFARETFEYPLIDGVSPVEGLTPLDQLDPPDIDLSNLDDLRGTLTLLRDAGALE